MADNKKYYYLKLKDNFYDEDAIIVLESMPEGYKYSNILLKLYLRSLKHEGKLMFNERIPYNPTILAQVTRHSVGVVEKALNLFKDLGLIEVLDNGAIYMSDIQNFIGKSSTEADRKREYRKKIDTEIGQMSGQLSDKSTPEIEIELKIEKDIEIKKEKKKEILVPEGIGFELTDKLEEFIQYRKEIKKPLKTDRSLKMMVNNIGKEFKDEYHLIDCIDFAIMNEYQGVKGDYVKYNCVKQSSSINDNIDRMLAEMGD